MSCFWETTLCASFQRVSLQPQMCPPPAVTLWPTHMVWEAQLLVLCEHFSQDIFTLLLTRKERLSVCRKAKVVWGK